MRHARVNGGGGVDSIRILAGAEITTKKAIENSKERDRERGGMNITFYGILEAVKEAS